MNLRRSPRRKPNNVFMKSKDKKPALDGEVKKSRLRIKKPSLKKAKLYTERLRRERQPKAMDYEQAVEDLPRITNETVAEHREQVIGSARRFIYPLQHSKKRIVAISSSIFGALVIGFIVYIMLSLYSFQTTSGFMYRVTQVLPLPVAKAGPSFVSYESYLFQLRHYMHYYQTQQSVDFASEAGKSQLKEYRKQALEQVVNYAYVSQLAKEHKVSVSDTEVDEAVAILKEQNRLGDNNQVLEDVLREYWGWTLSDFKRELRQQLLAQKVVAVLDTESSNKAQQALGELQGGADFATVAKSYSSSQTVQDDGGEYGALLDSANRDVSPKILQTLQTLKPGEVSGVVNTGAVLEIIKLIAIEDGKYRAAHISIELAPLTKYIDPLKEEKKPSYYIKQD